MVLPDTTNTEEHSGCQSWPHFPNSNRGNLVLRPVEGLAATIRTPGSGRFGSIGHGCVTSQGGIVRVGGQRDPDSTRAALIEWLGRQLPGAQQVEIENLVVPQSTGFSNETFL